MCDGSDESHNILIILNGCLIEEILKMLFMQIFTSLSEQAENMQKKQKNCEWKDLKE